jgi:DNA-binding NtrC family response regulator
MATLLILDRERRSRRALYSLLATRFNVVAVHGIFAAFRLLRRHRPDLVVVKTSGMDAFAMALLKWFQQQGLRIPTIVLVGHGAGPDANAVRQLGAGAVFRWPVASTELLWAVAAAAGHGLGHNGAGPVVHPKLAILTPLADGVTGAGRNGDGVRTWRPAPRIRPRVLRRT